MKAIITFLIFTFIFSNCFTQTYKVQWGEEMKVKKTFLDMDIVHADKSGVYMVGGRLQSYIGAFPSMAEAFKLYKFDPNYNVLYEKEYKKELDGLMFKNIQPLQGQLYLFAYDYKKKDKEYMVYGTKINNTTGDVESSMQELCSFQLSSKKDDLDFVIKPADDSTSWIVVGDITDNVSSAISVFVFDKNLAKKTSAKINLGFEPGTFDLEGITRTAGNKLLLMGRQYVFTEGKRRRQVRTFKQYVLSRYNEAGKKEKDIKIDIGDKYTIGGQLIPQKNGDIYLAGFYSNSSKRDKINGVMFHKIDVANGTLLQSAFQNINNSMLSKPITEDADDDKDSKALKKDIKKAGSEGDAEGLSSSFVIRNIIQNPLTNSLVIIAEEYSFKEYTSSMGKSQTVYSFENNDVLIINTDPENNKIKQVNIIPKSQFEQISDYGVGSAPTFAFNPGFIDFFERGGSMPFYSSFTSLLVKNKVILFFNDHSSNANVKTTTDKVKTISSFVKSVVYGLSLDLSTGEMSKKMIFSNDGNPILMPRFGFVLGNDVYMPAMKVGILEKSEVKMGKISVQ